jgi:hypothetical protein
MIGQCVIETKYVTPWGSRWSYRDPIEIDTYITTSGVYNPTHRTVTDRLIKKSSHEDFVSVWSETVSQSWGPEGPLGQSKFWLWPMIVLISPPHKIVSFLHRESVHQRQVPSPLTERDDTFTEQDGTWRKLWFYVGRSLSIPPVSGVVRYLRDTLRCWSVQRRSTLFDTSTQVSSIR